MNPATELPPDVLQKVLNRVGELLDQLAPWRADDREHWLKVGMIIHKQCQGREDGLALLWKSWSRKSRKFKEGECERLWAGFDADHPDALGLGTLRQWVKEDIAAGVSPVIQASARIDDVVTLDAKGIELLNAKLRLGMGRHKPVPNKPPPPIKPPRPLDDLIKATSESIGGAETGRWLYHDKEGREVLCVVRYQLSSGAKAYRQFSKVAAGWVAKGIETNCPLYHLPEILKAGPDDLIVLCEGEKAADAASSLGFTATTSCQGAQSPAKTDLKPLAGRTVAILPDNDEDGRKYARVVATLLVNLEPPARVKVIELPGLPARGDVVEYVEARQGQAADSIRAEVEVLAAKATELAPGDLIGGPVLVCMADVEAREIDWLWQQRIALGRITLLVGRPGEGKSFLAIEMAAHVSTGTPWPDGSPCPKGSVILICAEDDPGDTIKPRLEALHADCTKVQLLSMVRRVGKDGKRAEVLFTLEDKAALEAAIQAHPDCKLIVVDPIGSFLGGGTDAHRDNEVRTVLTPIATLAEKYGAAVLVIAHRRKSTGSIADDLALGSRAFTGIARAVHHLSRDPENKARRLLLPGKNNLAPEGTGLAFSIGGEPPAIVWERDPVAMTADEALSIENAGGNDAKPGPEPDTRRQAAEWLRGLLKAGAMESAKIKDEAKAAGYSWRTVHRAKDELGIVPTKTKSRIDGPWTWELPATK